MFRKTLLAALIASSAGLAAADIISFKADISGDNEVTPTGSPATGLLVGELDTDTSNFSFEWVISDELLGTPTEGAHLHHAPAGSNGPVVFGFSNSDGSWELTGSAVWLSMTAEQIDWLMSGEIYVNFHTSAVPSGEVRGQIAMIPSPGGAGVLALTGLLCLRRRR